MALTYQETMDIYGNISNRVILEQNTPQEAIAKLKEYEDAQNKIEVGDVVILSNGNTKAVVTFIYEDKCIYGISTTGELVADVNIKDCKKTGKHIDISSILEQIGG